MKVEAEQASPSPTVGQRPTDLAVAGGVGGFAASLQLAVGSRQRLEGAPLPVAEPSVGSRCWQRRWRRVAGGPAEVAPVVIAHVASS